MDFNIWQRRTPETTVIAVLIVLALMALGAGWLPRP